MKSMRKNNSNQPQYSSGFTLLFAVIISSLLLSIGIAILDLALKQFSLTSTSQNSQVAFYAADDGLECALFWDRSAPEGSVFATSSYSNLLTQTGAVTCNGSISTSSVSQLSPTAATSTFWVFYATSTPYSSAPCAYVSVAKTGSTTSPQISTAVESYGYDICNPTNPNITERSIESNY